MRETRHRRPILIALVLGLLCLGPAASSALAGPLDGDGMWIWYVNKSSRGNPDAMAAKAHRNGVNTVIIKSGDARDPWRQFSPVLVQELKARGLRVCAYQFVYGRYPRTEANLGVRAAKAGADCLLIDAEGHYEGKYGSARTYIKRLRNRLGYKYPIGLTSFPYVHYHPGFPYSVFLGPGGAQYNVPQMYWKDIGVSVDKVFSVAYQYNRPYKRKIFPLGQVYNNPKSSQVARFRQLGTAYGAPGVSWWVWQFAGNRQWTALGSPFAPLASPRVNRHWPYLRRGNRSDLVVWAQMQLRAWGLKPKMDGVFGKRMRTLVALFQTQRGIVPSGSIGDTTWRVLNSRKPKAVRWSSKKVLHSSAGGSGLQPPPASARAKPRRNELRGSPRG
jgi:Putative peptidoglycan binding domain